MSARAVAILGDDCNKAGGTAGEAQHGQAAGQTGIYAGFMAILRWVATLPAPAAAAQMPICIEVKDVELAEVVVRISLLIRKELRCDQQQSCSDDALLYSAPAHRALALDCSKAAFAPAYGTRADRPTQADGAAAEEPAHARQDSGGADTPILAEDSAVQFGDAADGERRGSSSGRRG